MLADIKDGGVNGGTTSAALRLQFANSAFDREFSFDPGAEFQTAGICALSDSAGGVSEGFGLPLAGTSMYVDNVRLCDVSETGNRICNGGFEDSTSTVVNWQSYDLSGASQFTASVTTDSNSGARAIKIERTVVGTADAGFQPDPTIPVFGNESIRIVFAAKKLSGASSARLHVSVNEFTTAGQLLASTVKLVNSGNWYDLARIEQQVAANAAFVSVVFRVGSSSSDKYVGAYAIDDVYFMHNDNLLPNGSFECSRDGDVGNTSNGINTWRAFAVGGAVGSATVRAGAGTDGNVFTEITRGVAGGGDSALDKDTSALRVRIPATDRIYRFSADFRDGSLYGGTSVVRLGTQFVAGYGEVNQTTTLDPGTALETLCAIGSSGASGLASVRIDLSDGSANRSAMVDNVRMIDVTRADRVLNGGFEASRSRPVNWTAYGVAGDSTATISTDANSGRFAMKLSRTDIVYDGGIDSNRTMVRGGETLQFSYAAKKLSGDSTVHCWVQLLWYDSGSALLRTDTFQSDVPVLGAYQQFARTMTAPATARYVALKYKVGDNNGSDKDVGSYLLDNVRLIANQKPSLTSAAIVPASPTIADVLSVSASGFSDADSDPEQYLYQWFRNGAAITGATSAKLSPASFATGDRITCTVTPFDGTDAGAAVNTPQVTISAAGVGDWAKY